MGWLNQVAYISLGKSLTVYVFIFIAGQQNIEDLGSRNHALPSIFYPDPQLHYYSCSSEPASMKVLLNMNAYNMNAQLKSDLIYLTYLS